jgi:large conductance mechanosensitive channel
MAILSEFKTFAMRGNVVDLAVGVVIGAAFGKIVTALVGGIVMPPLGLLIGGVDFSDLAVVLKPAQIAADGTVIADAVTLAYGAFLQTCVDFLIIAFAIFLVVKVMNSLKKKEEAAPAAPPEPSNEEKLLAEIRDLLKSRGG